MLIASSYVFAEGNPPICAMTHRQKINYRNCVAKFERDNCAELPKDLQRNCVDEPADNEPIDLSKCAKGGLNGISKAIEGVTDVIAKGYWAAVDKKGYGAEVFHKANEVCSANKEILGLAAEMKAVTEKGNAAKNVGYFQDKFMELNDLKQQKMRECLDSEIAKGRRLGIDPIPDLHEIKRLFFCTNYSTKFDLLCEFTGPLTLGGVAGKLAKAERKAILRRENENQGLSRVNQAVDRYIEALSKDKDLPEAEVRSIRHQKDIVGLLKNREVVGRLQAAGVDIEAMVQGMLDSDLGKLGKYKKNLTQKSADSDRLISFLRLDGDSRGVPALRELLEENGIKGKGIFNKDLSNDQIRQAFNDMEGLQNYLHETPGMLRALDDLETNRITPQQFKARIGANLFHNGPDKGFWGFFTKELIGKNMDKKDSTRKFFENSIFEGETILKPDGSKVVLPAYRNPLSKEGLMHTIPDRLSGGTDGPLKFFPETYGKKMSKDLAEPIGAVPNPFGEGTTNGLDFLRTLMVGNAKRQAKSNGESSLDQLKEIQNLVLGPKYFKGAEKPWAKSIADAAVNRQIAFNSFMRPPYVEFIVDQADAVKKLILRDPRDPKKVVGTISTDTKTNDAMRILEEFYKREQKVNGALEDLIKPRVLTPDEILANSRLYPGLGLAAGAAVATNTKNEIGAAHFGDLKKNSPVYYYCNQAKPPVTKDPQQRRSERRAHDLK